MDINNIWINREEPVGKWFRRDIVGRKWHQRLRLRLIKWLLKSLLKSLRENSYRCKIETGNR